MSEKEGIPGQNQVCKPGFARGNGRGDKRGRTRIGTEGLCATGPGPP